MRTFFIIGLLPLLSACANAGPNERQDTFVGAGLGALLGSQFGHGEGKLLGAGIGAVLGGTLGNAVGQDVDKN